MTKNKGWRGESWRHSLAARGIKTKGIRREAFLREERPGEGRIPVKPPRVRKGGRVVDVSDIITYADEKA